MLSALWAHAINANFELNLNKLVFQIIAIITLSSIFSQNEFFGPKLALLITIIQSSTHIVLGGSSNSAGMMFLTHLFFGFTAFYIITYFENIWNTISDAFEIIVFEAINFCLNVPTLEILIAQSFQSTNTYAPNRYRGPPLSNSEVL
jgi:hypothetical protein